MPNCHLLKIENLDFNLGKSKIDAIQNTKLLLVFIFVLKENFYIHGTSNWEKKKASLGSLRNTYIYVFSECNLSPPICTACTKYTLLPFSKSSLGSTSGLFNRTFCNAGHVLYLHCSASKPLASCSCWTLEIWLVWQRNWMFNFKWFKLNLNII